MVLNAIARWLSPPRLKRTRVAASDQVPDDEDSESTKDSKWICFCCSCKEMCRSFGNDLDVGTDWIYYSNMSRDPSVAPWLQNINLVFVILASVVFAMQVTDGRLFRRLIRFLSCGKVEVTMKSITKWGVWVEDVPQIVITSLVEIQRGWSGPGLLNLGTSVVDAMQKTNAIMTGDIEEPEDDDEVVSTNQERSHLLSEHV